MTDQIGIEELDKIAEYSLTDLAKTVAINSNEANETLASQAEKKCLGGNYKYRTNSEPVINSIPISSLMSCYITEKNKENILVTHNGSDVLYKRLLKKLKM